MIDPGINTYTNDIARIILHQSGADTVPTFQGGIQSLPENPYVVGILSRTRLKAILFRYNFTNYGSRL